MTADDETPKVDEAKSPADAWVEANKAARGAATWVIVAIGALGVAIFGATPLIKVFDLSWQEPDDRVQLRWAALLGVVGLLAMIGLILIIGRSQVPILGTRNLSRSARKIVENDALTWLPDGMRKTETLAQAIVTAREAERDARVRLRGLSSPGNDLEIATAKRFIAATEKRIASLEAWMSQIVRLDTFQRVRGAFLNPAVIALAFVAAVGSLGFTLALVSGEHEDPAADLPPTPQLGFLSVGPDAEATANLFSALDLDECLVNDRVPVVVLETDGSTSTVETVPSETCGARRFEVVLGVVALEFSVDPSTTEIEYTEVTPAPGE